MYQDTKVHCKDQMFKTNKLVMALLFPQLGSVEGFNNDSSLEFILPDWMVRDVQEVLEKILGLNDKENVTLHFENTEKDCEPAAEEASRYDQVWSW